MRRVYIAFFLAPLLFSLFFGVYAVIAYPIMLFVTGMFGVPIFLALKKLGWLQWWHAFLAGIFCAICYIAIDILMSISSNLDFLVNSNNILFIEFGAFIGLLFWWLGLFRNPSFPLINGKFPFAILIVVPFIFILENKLSETLNTKFYEGRVTSVLVEPNTDPKHGQVLVKLKDGSTVQADYRNNTIPTSQVVGTCFHIMSRWSSLRKRRIFELNTQFGGESNDC